MVKGEKNLLEGWRERGDDLAVLHYTYADLYLWNRAGTEHTTLCLCPLHNVADLHSSTTSESANNVKYSPNCAALLSRSVSTDPPYEFSHRALTISLDLWRHKVGFKDNTATAWEINSLQNGFGRTHVVLAFHHTVDYFNPRQLLSVLFTSLYCNHYMS